MTLKRSLIVFAKRPKAGQVKTRLASVMGEEEAARLYGCMLHDTLRTVRTLGGDVVITLFYEPGEGAEAYFADAAAGMGIQPQWGDELGTRMERAFRKMFDDGGEAVVIVGTDIPHLPPDHLTEAFARLEDTGVDVVFGPATDGGYYLLGMKRLHSGLFSGIAWSTGTVLQESLDKCGAEGLNIALLPPCSDIDTPDDLSLPELLDGGTKAHLTRDFLHRFFAR